MKYSLVAALIFCKSSRTLSFGEVNSFWGDFNRLAATICLLIDYFCNYFEMQLKMHIVFWAEI